MPSCRSTCPKVSRIVPRIGSVPTSASISPKMAVASALTGEPSPSAAVAVMPSAASRKYSGEEKRSANLLIQIAAKISTKIESVPARNEPTAAMLSAAPPRPWRASL